MTDCAWTSYTQLSWPAPPAWLDNRNCITLFHILACEHYGLGMDRHQQFFVIQDFIICMKWRPLLITYWGPNKYEVLFVILILKYRKQIDIYLKDYFHYLILYFQLFKCQDSDRSNWKSFFQSQKINFQAYFIFICFF